MASNVDMSLGDLISKNQGSVGGNKGRGNTRGRRGSSGKSRNFRRNGRGRSSTSSNGFRNIKRVGNSTGRWSLSMYYGGPRTQSTMNKPVKLNISNLDYLVTDADIRELFSEFGMLRTGSVHYDRFGHSLGTAHVIFDRRANALQAIKKYNGVHLDGRPMRIEIDGEGRIANASVLNGTRISARNPKRLQGGPKPIDDKKKRRGGRNSRGKGKVDGRGKTGRKNERGRGKKKIPTAEELDAELEAYASQKPSEEQKSSEEESKPPEKETNEEDTSKKEES